MKAYTILRRLVLVSLVGATLAACRPAPTAVPPATELPTSAAFQATQTATATVPPPTGTPLPPTQSPLPSPTTTPQPYGPTNFPAGINPLTGMRASDPALLERRPLAVKVQLYPRSGRPAYGISQADNIWEYYQNGGLTRMHVVFYSKNADHVRPIRSARLFDAQLVRMYKSNFAFGGADQRILDLLYSTEFGNRFVLQGGAQSCPPMCREDPNGFNFLWTNTAEMQKYIEGKGIPNGRQNLDGLKFDANLPAGEQSTPGKRLNLRYSISAYSQWDYDPLTGKYRRQQDAFEASTPQDEKFEPLVDGATGQAITADNVVVIMSEHRLATEFSSTLGPNAIIRIILEGQGDAYAFRDGKAYKLLWKREVPTGLVSLVYPDGSPYPLKPGNTWFQVVGQTSRAETAPDGWRFQFEFP